MQLPIKNTEDLGPFDMRLLSIRYAAIGVHLFEFGLVDESRGLPQSEPGSHVDLHLPNGMVRQYSLLNPGADRRTVLLGIKRDGAGHGASKYIFESLKVSDVVKVGAPRNNFGLNLRAPHTVLIAGGIGITPIIAMKECLEARGLSWELHYACRSRPEMPFYGELAEDPRVRLHFDKEAGHQLDLESIVELSPEGAHLYCCGPGPMLDSFGTAAAVRSIETVHVEYFAARETSKLGHGFTLELDRTGRSINVADGQTILDALNEAGIDVRYSCRGGVCGACETRVIAGIPDHHDSILTEEERATNQTVMICCAGSRTDRLVLDI